MTEITNEIANTLLTNMGRSYMMEKEIVKFMKINDIALHYSKSRYIRLFKGHLEEQSSSDYLNDIDKVVYLLVKEGYGDAVYWEK